MKNRYLHDVSTLRLDSDKCTGCGMCVHVCPHEVFEIRDQKAVILEKDRCMECGACMKNCPFEAIFVRSGVGCAYAILLGKIRRSEPTCGCAEKECC